MRTVEQIEAMIGELCPGNPHRDPLFPRQIADGMHACYSNAVGLLDDARLLVSHARPARALSLSILALEELAKITMVCDAAAFGGDVDAWKEFWKEFGRHGPKQEKGAEYGTLMEEAFDSSPYTLTFSEGIARHLEQLKQSGFYVDCIDGEFRSPARLGAQAAEVLDFLFAAVEERADSFAELHATPEASEQTLRGALELNVRLAACPKMSGLRWFKRGRSWTAFRRRSLKRSLRAAFGPRPPHAASWEPVWSTRPAIRTFVAGARSI